MNDGLAAPLVMALLVPLGGHGPTVPRLLLAVAMGIGLGIAVPIVAVWLYRRPIFGASRVYKPVFALAVLILAWSAAKLAGANEYLAAFFAGAVMSARSEHAHGYWQRPGELLSEMLKLAALFLFGAKAASASLISIGWSGLVFALAALFLARPLAMLMALFGSELPTRERLVAAWFGPRGFASVVFGLVVHASLAANAELMFRIIASVVVASIVFHATTDSVAAKWLARRAES